MSGHTPEEWRWDDWVELVAGNRSRCLVATAPHYRLILRHEAETWELQDADAALIEAAPAMLEALGAVERAVDLQRQYDRDRSSHATLDPMTIEQAHRTAYGLVARALRSARGEGEG